jgi:hypothetical protein
VRGEQRCGQVVDHLTDGRVVIVENLLNELAPFAIVIPRHSPR